MIKDNSRLCARNNFCQYTGDNRWYPGQDQSWSYALQCIILCAISLAQSLIFYLQYWLYILFSDNISKNIEHFYFDVENITKIPLKQLMIYASDLVFLQCSLQCFPWCNINQQVYISSFSVFFHLHIHFNFLLTQISHLAHSGTQRQESSNLFCWCWRVHNFSPT